MINGQPTFIDSKQMPVYTDGGDTVPNQSTCTTANGCLQIWPIVAPPPGPLPAPFSSFTRSDNGQQQLSFNGKPLYTFVSDSPLHATGDNFQNFHLAHPDASAPAAPATAAPPASTPPPQPPPGMIY